MFRISECKDPDDKIWTGSERLIETVETNDLLRYVIPRCPGHSLRLGTSW